MMLIPDKYVRAVLEKRFTEAVSMHAVYTTSCKDAAAELERVTKGRDNLFLEISSLANALGKLVPSSVLETQD